jgi:hypothetical protein
LMVGLLAIDDVDGNAGLLAIHDARNGIHDIDRGLTCSKCDKQSTRKDHMIAHERRCFGPVNSKQCQICFKVFTSAWGRQKHNLNVKSSPPVSAPPPPPTLPYIVSTSTHLASSSNLLSIV